MMTTCSHELMPRSARRGFLAALAALAIGAHWASGAEAKPAGPDFGPNVLVFDPSMTTIQNQMDEVFAKQERNQFGPERYACLFKPGSYNLDFQMGFYMQAAGLGRSPDQVVINGKIRSTARWMNGNATCNFWRTIENLTIAPGGNRPVNQWAVSQGGALRRVHVKGDLHLWDGGWSSGGFMADCRVDGQVVSGSQQQWFSRNSQWNRWAGGVWNMVFVGTVNPPEGAWPAKSYTVVDKTPVLREKPYLFVDDAGQYAVMVPSLATDAQGTSWAAGATAGKPLPIDQFYLANPKKDTAASINAALKAGKHLLLTPGVYSLEESLQVTRPGTVVLGLGFPTLIPARGTAALTIADVDGVSVGGLMIDAGPVNSPTLLEAGAPGSQVSHAKDPVFLYDIFCRIGGATAGMADCMVTINSRDVAGDNFWLWRADHGKGAAWTVNKNKNGLVVNGDNATVYGLFVEHTQEYQTLWKGNGGRVYFYQSEMPYDPPSAAEWRPGAVTGWASYKVADTVTTHEAWGLGVYAYFAKASIIADTGIQAPAAPGVKIHHMVSIRLNGQPNSGIKHVINDLGSPVVSTMKTTLDEYPAKP